jgi:hypothetical protein
MKKSEIRNIIREEIISELQRGIWLQPNKKELEQFKEEMFGLIKKTYADIGGHPDFKSPKDITRDDISYWEFINIDSDPGPDAVSGAKIKPPGNKFVVGATDGSSTAKKAYLHSRINSLKRPGNYIEVSHKIADILLAKGVPIINSKENVEKILGKPVKWLGTVSGHDGDGWYNRKIGSDSYNKIMLGRPKI